MAYKIMMGFTHDTVTKSGICSVTGEKYSVSMTGEQFKRWRTDGEYIQDVCPELSDEQREFMISGCTPAEFDEVFPPEDE